MGSYLGQNFLIDTSIRHAISDAIRNLYTSLQGQSIIEIGPGKGSLTKLIWNISPHFLAIEKDEKMVALYRNLPSPDDRTNNIAEKIIHGDVLEVPIDNEIHNRQRSRNTTLIVGNLPYYITSPILRLFFGDGQGIFPGGIFLVQLEVAEKLITSAQKKSFLWWLINRGYEVSLIKHVPASAFSPAPKVKSAVIGITRKKQLLHDIPFDRLLLFLDLFAPYSRKTLGAISKIVEKQTNTSRTLPEHIASKRLEACSWEDIQKILSQ